MKNKSKEEDDIEEASDVQEKIVELSVEDVRDHVNKVQNLLRSVMKESEHYGKIPGIKKTSLLKPGAEKLCLLFMLVPRFIIKTTNMDNGHREHEVTCSMYHSKTEAFRGEGVGSCSTMESRYRWRKDSENTGKPVPKSYWDNRDIKLIGGKGFSTKKDEDGLWMIFKDGDRIENPDIADQYNTVLKMAKKRAYLDATITATRTSDIFTQDME